MSGSKDGTTTRMDRRRAMQLAGGAGVLAFAPQPAMAQDAAPKLGDEAMERSDEPGWRRYRIGEASVTVILDGLRVGEGPHPTFGADQEAGAVAELMRENFLPETRLATGFLPVLVESGDRLVLFDTGMGPGGRANGMGRLRERMEQAGYRPEDVDTVVLTHMHGDHIAGLIEGDGPAFPNARYAMGRVEYDWWTSDEAKAGDRKEGAAAVEKIVVPLAKDATFLKEGDEIMPGLVSHEAFGHSPGHLIFHLRSDEGSLWLTADTANHFVASLARPEWRVRFDQDPEKATATRRRVFDAIAQSREPFIGYHMPFPGIGFAQKTGEGYRFVPLTYQLDV